MTLNLDNFAWNKCDSIHTNFSTSKMVGKWQVTSSAYRDRRYLSRVVILRNKSMHLIRLRHRIFLLLQLVVKGTIYEQLEPVCYGILWLLALKRCFGTAGRKKKNTKHQQIERICHICPHGKLNDYVFSVDSQTQKKYIHFGKHNPKNVKCVVFHTNRAQILHK